MKQALSDPNWLTVMNDELEAIEKNKTWELVDQPLTKRAIDIKWVYK